MAYQIRFLEEYEIIETVYEGKVKVLDVIAVIRENLKLSKQKQMHLFLVDCLMLIDEMEFVFENHKVGTFMAKLFDQIPHNMRDAIILPESEIGKANLRFFETVARNRGLNVRVFETRDEALAWLLLA